MKRLSLTIVFFAAALMLAQTAPAPSPQKSAGEGDLSSVLAKMNEKATNPPIKNEHSNGLLNKRGTIAMARTNNPDSATAQFFINVKDNAFLNHTAKNVQGWGYAVFGKVVEGMDVVEKISQEPVKQVPPLFEALPVDQVVIKSIRRAQE